VNERIEGFFEVCKSNGLTGKQGVIIPQSNVKNLMLREDVIQSVKDLAEKVQAFSNHNNMERARYEYGA
jgi:predicted ATP-dependent protease